MPGEVVFAKVQLDMDSTASWGQLVLLTTHWVKSVSFCIIFFSFLLVFPSVAKGKGMTLKVWFG